MGYLSSPDAIPQREHLRDQVADALRAALTAGELRPGLIYSAPALAADLGVSATPVREAMLDLAREGLVEAVRNRGFRITEITERELAEYTEIRELIEIPTIRRVAKAATRDELDALRPQAEEILRAAERHDVVAYLEADRRFHLELLSLAGNSHLVQVVAELRERSRLYGLTGPGAKALLVESARERVELLNHLAAGDVKGAQECVRRHLRHVRSLWAEGRRDDGASPSPGRLRAGTR